MDGATAVDRRLRLDVDHHALLLLDGSAGGPSGSTSPREVRLRLTRTDGEADAFAQLHEVHHASLNDSTAWGTALHLFAEAPEAFDVSLGALTKECRLTHEAYATFAARSVLEGMLGPRPGLLDRWPQYRTWDRLVSTFVRSARGPERRYLLATALARVAMQVPVGEMILSTGPLFRPSMLRSVDRPDGRFRLLLRDGPAAAAAIHADERVPEADLVDTEDAEALVVAADEHDGTWGRWERAAYSFLMGWLVERGATEVTYNGHQETTQALLDRVAAEGRVSRLRAALPGAPPDSDLRTVSSVLAALHEDLADYTARQLEVDADDIADLVATHSRIGDEPVLVVTARLPERLDAAYRWDEPLADAADRPQWGIRLLETDGAGESVVVWIPLTIDDFPTVLERWNGRGRAIAVVSASCLIDAEWQRSELARVQQALPTLVWIDVPPERLMRSWTRDGVQPRLAGVLVNDVSGTWHSTVMTAAGSELLWFLLGSDATVGLFRQAFHAPSRLVLTEQQLSAFQIAATTTLAHETTLDFAGVDGRT